MIQRRCTEMQKTRTSIREEFLQFHQSSLLKEDRFDFFALLKSKTDNLPLRGYFAKKVYDYLIEDLPTYYQSDLADFFSGKVPFILEAVITIQYYHNQILDGKGGVYTPDRVKQNLILGNLLKDHLYDYIEKNCPKDTKEMLVKYVRQIFLYTDLGQYVEKKFNTYNEYVLNKSRKLPFGSEVENFISPKMINFLLQQAESQLQHTARLSFLKLYFERVYLVSSSLFRLTVELIGELLGISTTNHSLRNLIQFAEYYGLMIQLVNDNCDWIPETHGHQTVAKKESDALSDLRNRNVTYPLFLYLELETNDPCIRDFIEGYSDYIPEILQEEYFRKLVQSGVLRKAMKLANSTGKEALKFLDQNNCQREIFEDMIKISQFNRYYYHIINTEKKIKIKTY